jgi:Holliday junction resolvase RusA-like endonuclease
MDGDNMEAGVSDVLQTAQIFENDKQIRDSHWIIRDYTGRIDQTLVEIEPLDQKESPTDAKALIQSILGK